MYYLDQIILFFISLIANAFSAFVGGGAGLLQLPAIIFLGLSFSVALATHKVASVALGIGASLRHFRGHSLQWPISLLIVITGLPGVVLGGFVIVEVPSHLAQQALGVLTLVIGIYSLLNKELGQEYAPRHLDLSGFVVGGLVLFLMGAVNGSLTSGTGLLVTLWLIYWFGLDYRRAVAYTLVFVGVFWNGAGAITLGLLSQIHWPWLGSLILGSLLGGYLGAHLAISKGNVWIKRGFELVTFAVAIKLLWP